MTNATRANAVIVRRNLPGMTLRMFIGSLSVIMTTGQPTEDHLIQVATMSWFSRILVLLITLGCIYAGTRCFGYDIMLQTIWSCAEHIRNFTTHIMMAINYFHDVATPLMPEWFGDSDVASLSSRINRNEDDQHSYGSSSCTSADSRWEVPSTISSDSAEAYPGPTFAGSTWAEVALSQGADNLDPETLALLQQPIGEDSVPPPHFCRS